MKEAVLCAKYHHEGTVIWHALRQHIPLDIDHTSALHVARNWTCGLRIKQVAVRHIFLQKIVEGCRIIDLHVKTGHHLADVGTKYLSRSASSVAFSKLISAYRA